ncbi:MAG: DUF4071 domain-containing protein [bacterium]|nr:DUF4071 domain-containing protein [bacterium]
MAPDSTGRSVDFDAVFALVVEPALRRAGLGVVRSPRSDLELVTGRFLDAVLLSRHFLVDLSCNTAHAYYALGLRRAAGLPDSTLIAVEGVRPSLDAVGWRVLRYPVGRRGDPERADDLAERLARELVSTPAPEGAKELTLAALLSGQPPAPIERLKTDSFRERAGSVQPAHAELARARGSGDVSAVAAIHRTLARSAGGLAATANSVLIDLLLSYRAVSAWQQMVDLHRELPAPLRETALAREQYALALNRIGRSDEAEAVLEEILAERGPSSETCGLLGRIHKDRWQRELGGDDPGAAGKHLRAAIRAYRLGFESDWRDAYPGINLLTLMTLQEPPDPERLGILPIVRYAAERRVATGHHDYWDHATRVELAVLDDDEPAARRATAAALEAIRERWEPESTSRNLRLLTEVRRRRGEKWSWVEEIAETLGGTRGS